jgi:catechol 2,3-dioxygenase-like lactoylglutathione lyase family enzyme
MGHNDAMILGGNATIYVRDMDRAVRFYVETLGLKLKHRFGDQWAEVDAGPGLTIGLHPESPNWGAAPGTKGAVGIGFTVAQPLEKVVETLRGRGVAFQGPIVEGGGGRFASLSDPDGNALYLWQVEFSKA